MLYYLTDRKFQCLCRQSGVDGGNDEYLQHRREHLGEILNITH